MTVNGYKLPFTCDVYVMNVYRPSIGDVDTFFKYLQHCTCISRIRNNKEYDICIGGDYNIDYFRKYLLTHSMWDLFRVFDIGFGQIEDILGIILAKELFKNSD